MLLSSTVMTPSLPTLSIASAMISPTVVSAAEIDAVAAICSLVSTSLAWLPSTSDTDVDGLLDAALEGHRVGAGRDVAQPFLDQRLGQHGRRRRAVTGHVVGLLRYFLDQLGADLLARVVELDLLGDADAVVGDRGGAPLPRPARRCGPSGPASPSRRRRGCSCRARGRDGPLRRTRSTWPCDLFLLAEFGRAVHGRDGTRLRGCSERGGGGGLAVI